MKLDRPICKTALYRTGKRWYNLFSFSGKEMLMEQQQKTRKHAAFAVIRIVLILLLFGIVAFSAYRIYAIVHEYAIGQDTYRSVADAFLITPSPVPKNAAVPIPTPVPSDSELPSASPDPDDDRIAGTAPIAVDFERLLQENGDCVGWIYCEDTKINYPVMQSDDNAAYLHRLFDGSYNSSGSLFMDFRNDPNLTDLNTVIFGHSMKDHSMFATLRDFRNQTFYALIVVNRVDAQAQDSLGLSAAHSQQPMAGTTFQRLVPVEVVAEFLCLVGVLFGLHYLGGDDGGTAECSAHLLA